jgi:hypothetical protein
MRRSLARTAAQATLSVPRAHNGLLAKQPVQDLRPSAAPPVPAGAESRRQSTQYLNQIDLARRWRISPRTLERWRWLNQGPAYLKIGGRVVYRVEDIEAYEAMRRS